ncbi:vanadium-dependent haloperoxidase [Bradyrhizobium sp. TZ2]
MIAMLWGELSLFRTFNEIARNLISARNDDLWESNRTLALLNVAMADSYVAVFEAKYHYQFWRPTMAIRWADGNEKTTSDAWLPLRPTPPFPEYPSGHAAACGSAQIILESAFGLSTPFAATGTTLFPAGYSRNFSSFDYASRECVEGRMLSGQHFRFSDEDALYLGQHVSRYVIRNILAAR